jgi:dCMP deaminase
MQMVTKRRKGSARAKGTGKRQDGIVRPGLVYGQNPGHKRPGWDDYFLEIMHTVAKRANCDRGRTAAVLVKNKQIIATGYVGAPAGCPTCDEVGHLMKTVYDERGGQHQHCVRTTHGEANAIAQAARHGIPTEGATIYCKFEPCLDCTKLLINAGIKRVVCERKYHAAHDSREMLKRAGIELVVLHDEEEQYEKMR